MKTDVTTLNDTENKVGCASNSKVLNYSEKREKCQHTQFIFAVHTYKEADLVV